MALPGRFEHVTGIYDEPRRPSHQNFDSLQDLLEQAGYEETRIFTPASVHNLKAHSTPPRAATPLNSEDVEPILSPKSRTSSTSTKWFSNFWRSRDAIKGEVSVSNSRQKALNRKQSEPVLTRKGRKAVQKSWLDMWGTSGPHLDLKDTIESDAARVPAAEISIESSHKDQIYNDSDSFQVSSVKASRPPLRHAPSTSDLWRGSLHHHRSFPNRIKDKNSTLRRMESFDGAAVVAGVGMAPAKSVSTDLILTAKPKQRRSLRQAFAELAKDDVQQKKVQEIKLQSKINNAAKGDQLVWADSVGTLTDLDDRQKATDVSLDAIYGLINAPTPPSALFSTAAIPLLSRQEAVALRNVDCLDFAAMHHGDDKMAEPTRRSLRKMRSVDALELALAKMEKRQQATRAVSATRHDTIPESFSAESLTNEDLASGATVTTVVDGLLLHQEGLKEDIVDPVQRSNTPRLMLTSPTGLRSPQEIHLEGREYEPRSYSPEMISLDRIVADSLTGWKVNASIVKPEAQRGRHPDGIPGQADLSQFATVPKRSSSRRRSRTIRTREISLENGDLSIPPRGKEAKKRTSKSCHDLRNAAQTSMRSQNGDANQMSGSEQVRALKREVMERSKTASKRRGTGTTSAAIPCSPLEGDCDDPFSDLNNMAKAASSSSQERAPADHFKTSSVPFEPVKQRRPLSVTQAQVQAQSQIQVPSSLHSDKPLLNKKKSGVGIACLVEKESQRKHIATNDENEAPDSLLESPTVQIVKKRSSRSVLR